MRGLRAALVAMGVLVPWVARGDVVTSLAGTQLTVTGDDTPDAVDIEPSPGGLSVTGFAGTLVDGSTLPATFAGVTRLTVKLGPGADTLTIRQVTLDGPLKLGLGRGNDAVELDQVFAHKLGIRTSKGYDAVRIYGPSRLGSVSIQSGSGNDLVVLDGASVEGRLDVDAGADDDDVNVVATRVTGDVDLHLDDGDDVLVVGDVTFEDDAHFAGGHGEDVLVLYGYVWIWNDVDVDDFGDDDSWWWW